eukprot:362467-Chlamydomonas_euryale.AAC.2
MSTARWRLALGGGDADASPATATSADMEPPPPPSSSRSSKDPDGGSAGGRGTRRSTHSLRVLAAMSCPPALAAAAPCEPARRIGMGCRRAVGRRVL